MTRSGPPVVTQSSNSKEKEKRKVFHDHGKDSLELAISIGKAQEDKALLKAGKHHQPQAGQPGSERRCTQRKSGTKQKTKLEEVKATIANQRARLKRVKARSRKERPVCAVDQISDPSSNAQDRAPRKRVSFV
ncbi:hypothetical protein AZE42_05383 [Rhizopogon vesiculosus]|uniref:Uncharacterized protein n=1 Tax=Rhizopogon vesiculosus TaxID=180088 RepID=A0A1J8QGT2_9AGAM|nr:hypothetical protein AZE42_05383 [Rhizopogon vesiculosus]